jgi:hypothetical protein
VFHTDEYQQVLDVTPPRNVTDVRLNIESAEIHVLVESATEAASTVPM